MDLMSSAHSETDGESEGVWSPEIERAFQEALKLFPPCGRRKHILQEEGGGKMYGRNELIARYIEQKTGQRRTRKQVSSHIQVLSRREARARTGSRTDDAESVSPASSINAPSSAGGGSNNCLGLSSLGSLRPDSATSGSAFSLNGSNGTHHLTTTPAAAAAAAAAAHTAMQIDSNTTGGGHMPYNHDHNHHHLHSSSNNHHHHHHNLHRQGQNHLVEPMLQFGSASHNRGQNPANDSQFPALSNGHQHHNQHQNHHLHLHHHHHQQQQQQIHPTTELHYQNSNNNYRQQQHHHLAAAAAAAWLNPYEIWEDRAIMTRKIRLVEFSAFVEKRQPPTPTTMNNNNNQQATLSQPAAVLGATSLAASNGSSGNTPDMMMVDDGPINSASSIQQASSVAANQQALASGQQQQYALGLSVNSDSSSSGFQRHPFVKIDCRQLFSIGQQANKMERIDIREIQDKFPDIGGPNGLFERSCASDAFFLVKFWADLDFDNDSLNGATNNSPSSSLYEDQNSYFGFSNHFETMVPYKDITCSTKACSYGVQVVEKIDKIHSAFNSSNNTYSYVINRSPMCEFMIQFIKKLRQLPEPQLMNRILENFTVLQIVSSESTSETLLCIAYVFEIASLRQTNGSHYHVYKLIDSK